MKKILPIIILTFLVIWGVYDIVHKNSIDSGNANSISQSGTADTAKKIGLQNGNLAPDFELKTLDDKSVKLSDYKGKKIILNFWATWCPPCKAEIPDLEKFYSDFKDRDTVILGVDLTENEKSKADVSTFVETYGITYSVLLDYESMASEKYQVSAIPTSYIIDTKGIIKNKIVGPMDYKALKSMLEGID